MEYESTIDRVSRVNDIQQVVNTSNPVYKSMQGKYFIGTTHVLYPGQNTNAWGILINPSGSGVNLYVSTFTVSNYSSVPFVSQAWINSVPPGNGLLADKVSPANTSISPLPKPRIGLYYARQAYGVPQGGAHVFDRIAVPQSTITDEKDGKIIIPPGGSFMVFLVSPGMGSAVARIAFGWWEDTV